MSITGVVEPAHKVAVVGFMTIVGDAWAITTTESKVESDDEVVEHVTLNL